MISRRIFLKDGGLALVSLGFAPAFLARTVEGIAAGRQKVLIAIFQRGAVDGLNMIVPFGDALRQIAQLIKADVGLEVAFAESGNWDHHANEGAAVGVLANRLDDLSRGIAALVRDLGDRMQDVVVMTMSEFGRAVTENGSRGTDHGHGNAMMILGGAVRGGKVYGRWPGLAREQRHDGRDLAITTDFRAVFNEVVRGHLGLSETSRVFPGFQGSPPLGLMA